MFETGSSYTTALTLDSSQNATFAGNVSLTGGALSISGDGSNATTLTEVEKVAKNVIASVDVAGYYPDKTVVHASGAQYTAYVLLRYSDIEAQKIIITNLVRTKKKAPEKAIDIIKKLNPEDDEVNKSNKVA